MRTAQLSVSCFITFALSAIVLLSLNIMLTWLLAFIPLPGSTHISEAMPLVGATVALALIGPLLVACWAGQIFHHMLDVQAPTAETYPRNTATCAGVASALLGAFCVFPGTYSPILLLAVTLTLAYCLHLVHRQQPTDATPLHLPQFHWPVLPQLKLRQPPLLLARVHARLR